MANYVEELTAIDPKIDIGIGADNRKAVSSALCQLLADEHILYIKTRNYHWNVTGMYFKPLHELFEDQYTAMAAFIDDIAERIRSLGFFAPGSMDEFRGMARLVETNHLKGDAKHMLQNLIRDHETIIQILRHDQEAAAGRYGDDGTNDFLIGLMEEHEKMVWMLRAHLNE
jgi:starvation-inducible DNA-binding protein